MKTARASNTPILLTATASIATLAIFASDAKAGWEWQGSIDSLITAVIIQAEKSMGKVAGAPKVTFGWCKGRTAYLIRNKHICFDPAFIKAVSRIGDAAVAYVAAHEYAHHIQYSSRIYNFKAQGFNTLQLELQADCFAGVILGTIPGVYFDSNDIREMIYTASIIGDHEYDEGDHHGSGETRALALRSGLRLAASGQKDNYYRLYCGQN